MKRYYALGTKFNKKIMAYIEQVCFAQFLISENTLIIREFSLGFFHVWLSI